MQKLALGFFALILVGAFLLWLPISNVDGSIPFIDALFSATSAVCVTGLMTIVPAVQFTLFGKIVLLILIQIGGLGVIACTILFFVIIGRKITVRDRVLIQETYNLDTLSGMVSLIIKIVKITLLIEAIGAVLFAFQFVPEFGAVGIWYAVFHSISAFCNAGIDILGDSSFIGYATNPIINFTTMGLIIAGGLGFTVWPDLYANLKLMRKGKIPLRKIYHKLTLHSRIVLLMTGILITLGFAFYLVVEWNNSATIGDMSIGQKMMAALFQSVTTRTAGFASVDQAGLTDASAFFTTILMFIGGSPAGTAGGVKTTTVFMLIMTCVATLRGMSDTEVFGRKIPEGNVKSGITIILISFFALVLGLIALNLVETVDFLDGLYEVSSAIGTVGLSRGVTSEIGTAGKIVDIILMYMGRIGPVTIALAFGNRRDISKMMRELPTRRIMVG